MYVQYAPGKKRKMSFLSTSDHCYQYKRRLYEVIYEVVCMYVCMCMYVYLPAHSVQPFYYHGVSAHDQISRS